MGRLLHIHNKDNTITKTISYGSDIVPITFEYMGTGDNLYEIIIEIDGQKDSNSFFLEPFGDWFTYRTERSANQVKILLFVSENLTTVKRYGGLYIKHNAAPLSIYLDFTQEECVYSITVTPVECQFNQFPTTCLFEERIFNVTASGGRGQWYVKNIEKEINGIQTMYDGALECYIKNENNEKKLVIRSYGKISLENNPKYYIVLDHKDSIISPKKIITVTYNNSSNIESYCQGTPSETIEIKEVFFYDFYVKGDETIYINGKGGEVDLSEYIVSQYYGEIGGVWKTRHLDFDIAGKEGEELYFDIPEEGTTIQVPSNDSDKNRSAVLVCTQTQNQPDGSSETKDIELTIVQFAKEEEDNWIFEVKIGEISYEESGDFDFSFEGEKKEFVIEITSTKNGVNVSYEIEDISGVSWCWYEDKGNAGKFIVINKKGISDIREASFKFTQGEHSPQESIEVRVKEVMSDKEIWYTSNTEQKINLSNTSTSIISNVYENGKGVITFNPSPFTDNLFNFDGRTEEETQLLTVILPPHTRDIQEKAFYNCQYLKSVESNGIEEIYPNAFCGCCKLSLFEDSNSIKTIGEHAFQSSGLFMIDLPVIEEIGDAAFSSCNNLTSVKLSEKIKKINDEVFNGCIALTEIALPASVVELGNNVFSGCSTLSSIIVKDGNAMYDSRNNCNAIIDTNTNALLYGCKKTIIPNSVTSISDNAFNGCSGIENITIPNSVTTIGENVFSNCENLTTVDISDSVTTIGESAFRNCGDLKKITIPNSVTSIGENTFGGCMFAKENFVNNSSLKDSNNWGAILYDSETENGLFINGTELSNCRPKITNVTIPEKIETIGEGAFSGHSTFTTIEIPDSVIGIGDYAFQYCSGLTNIEIPDSVTTIGKWVFSECYNLTNVKVSKSVNIIDDYTFYKCSGLTSIEIPNSVTSIGESAFYDCKGLTSVTIPNSVTSIGNEALKYCGVLRSIKYNGTIEQWDKIQKGERWNEGVPSYCTVYCTDGDKELIKV